jgi:hypothetical protein
MNIEIWFRYISLLFPLWFYAQTKLTAINTQQILTYGLNRSPIRAHFQNMPKTLQYIHQRIVPQTQSSHEISE